MKFVWLLFPMLAIGQTPGENIFTERCIGCHGTGQAPVLSGNRRVRARSIEQLRDTIEHGIPAGGMPAFDLPREQLDAVAGYVRSLNSAAADNPVAGDRAAGERIFFGQCASCHILHGPDLSNVAHEMTA
jgi:mono/diheme cytochrome c family protein